MSIQGFSYNPFSFRNAQSAWSNQTDSCLLRVPKTFLVGFYDVYVKNPYDLTINNVKTLINSSGPLSTKTKIAVVATVAFGLLYTLMLYGTSLHLLGRALLGLGTSIMPPLFIKSGEVLKKLGTSLFVAGAAPIYVVFYALPKRIILSLPKAVCYVAEKISVGAKWTFENLIQPLWNQVIVPAFQTLGKALKFAATKIGVALEAIGTAIANTVRFLFQHILKPFWNKVVIPVVRQVAHFAKWIFHNIIHPLWNNIIVPTAHKIGQAIASAAKTIAQSAQWVFRNLITPFWNKVIVPIFNAFSHAFVNTIKFIGQAIASAAKTIAQSAQWVFRNLITPFWNTIISPVFKAIGNVISTVVNVTASTLKILISATANVVSCLFQNVIIPVLKGIGSFVVVIGKFLGNYVIQPMLSAVKFTADKVGAACYAIFQGLIVPTAKTLAAIAQTIKNSFQYFSNDIWALVSCHF